MIICVLLSVAFNLSMKCACLRLFEKDPTIIIMNCAWRSRSSTALEKQHFIMQIVSVFCLFLFSKEQVRPKRNENGSQLTITH